MSDPDPDLPGSPDAEAIEDRLITGIKIAGTMLALVPVGAALAIAAGNRLIVGIAVAALLVLLGTLVYLQRLRTRLDQARTQD